MSKLPTKLSTAAFTGIVTLAVLQWFLLARRMPFRYFSWFCLPAGAFMIVELVVAKFFGERSEQNRMLRIALELALGSVFVVMFYLFAVHVYPGMRWSETSCKTISDCPELVFQIE